MAVGVLILWVPLSVKAGDSLGSMYGHGSGIVDRFAAAA